MGHGSRLPGQRQGQGVTTGTFTLTTGGGAPVAAALTSDAAGATWTLDPDSGLAGTVYTVTLTGGPDAIRDLGNNALPTQNVDFTTAATTVPPPGDAVSPTVTAKTPAPGATNFSRTGNVTVTFSEPVENVTTGPSG